MSFKVLCSFPGSTEANYVDTAGFGDYSDLITLFPYKTGLVSARAWNPDVDTYYRIMTYQQRGDGSTPLSALKSWEKAMFFCCLNGQYARDEFIEDPFAKPFVRFWGREIVIPQDFSYLTRSYTSIKGVVLPYSHMRNILDGVSCHHLVQQESYEFISTFWAAISPIHEESQYMQAAD